MYCRLVCRRNCTNKCGSNSYLDAQTCGCPCQPGYVTDRNSNCVAKCNTLCPAFSLGVLAHQLIVESRNLRQLGVRVLIVVLFTKVLSSPRIRFPDNLSRSSSFVALVFQTLLNTISHNRFLQKCCMMPK